MRLCQFEVKYTKISSSSCSRDCHPSRLPMNCKLHYITKFSHISSFIRNSLHWLPIRKPIQFKVCNLFGNCLIGFAPQYLKAYCIPVSYIHSRSTPRWVGSSLGHERLRLNLEV